MANDIGATEQSEVVAKGIAAGAKSFVGKVSGSLGGSGGMDAIAGNEGGNLVVVARGGSELWQRTVPVVGPALKNGGVIVKKRHFQFGGKGADGGGELFGLVQAAAAGGHGAEDNDGAVG